jgi:glycosyltransferase involved in cell wall biosynthesis
MNPPSQPKISVCIPTYNGEDYIGESIESVLSQTYPNFELVITDDCSTDRTLDIIKKNIDSRIRSLKNERNLGAEGNSNKVLSEARGKYIKVLHHDDLLYPSCLESQIEILEAPENKDVVLVCCGRDIIDEKDRKILQRRFKGKSGKFPGIQIIKKTVQSGTNLIGEPSSVLFRSDVLRKTGGFDHTIPYLTDLDLWCRMLLHGDIYISSDVLCAFRVSSTSLSVAIGHSQKKDFNKFVDRLYEDKRYHLDKFDCLIGKVKAYFYSIFRNLLYIQICRRKKELD